MSDLPGASSASGNRGILTPRQILNARQARQRTKQESRQEQEPAGSSADAERQRREEERQRGIELERRKSAERRANATAQQRDSGYRTGGSTVGGRTPGSAAYGTPSTNDPSGTTPYARSQQQYGSGTAQDAPTGYRTAGTPSRNRPVSTTQQLGGQQPTYTSSSRVQPYDRPQGDASEKRSQGERQQRASDPAQQQQEQQLPSQLGRSTFPHAFERWEQLSAQWEGITSSFNRRLELYVSEAGPLPPDQAVMGRQIADLSAAGANLFHAVVELQRLRASSERKFQRWFFEMDARDREANQRIDELEQQVKNPPVNENDRRLGEMRRELQISKEEAKRAWLELGRREDLERDQQQDLREGKAVFVGGVQVLPSSVVNRGASLRQPGVRDVYNTQGGAPQAFEYNEPSPTDTDPFTETRQRTQPFYPSDPSSSYIQSQQQQPPLPTSLGQGNQQARSPPGSGSSGRFYNQPQTFLHNQPQQAPAPTRSGGAFSTSESDDEHPAYDEQGQPLFDSSGRPIMFRGQQGTSSIGTDTGGGGTGILPGPGPTASAATYSQSGFSSSIPAPSISGGGSGGGANYGGISTTSAGMGSAAMPPPPIPPSVLRQQRDIERERARQAQEGGTIREVISSPEPSDSESGGEDQDHPAYPGGGVGAPGQRDDEEDDYDRHQRRVARNQARYSQGGQSEQADYEGEGFGSGQGWDEMEVGRHHHPTRLSDVMEEEEELRSRTSRGSPGVR